MQKGISVPFLLWTKQTSCSDPSRVKKEGMLDK
jgi:hypothetical protein